MTTILNGGNAVTTEAQLNAAILAADNAVAYSGGYQILLGANLSISTPLDAINLPGGVNLDIQGRSFTLDGGGTQRGLFVYGGVVTISDLTLAAMTARGGAGANGGGGGAGRRAGCKE